MATKKSKRDFTVVELDPIDSTVVDVEATPASAAEGQPATFQTYNWWLDTVTDESWAYYNDSFTKDEIEKIIALGQSKLSAGDSEVVDGKNTRSWIRSDLQENHWIFQRLVNVLTGVNKQFFNYEISYIDNLQFIAVDKDKDIAGKYTDSEFFSTGTKKISFVVQLSANDDYEGGDLVLHTSDTPTPLPKQQGTTNIFPAYTLREMLPVTKGTNYVLIGSVIGPRFK